MEAGRDRGTRHYLLTGEIYFIFIIQKQVEFELGKNKEVLTSTNRDKVQVKQARGRGSERQKMAAVGSCRWCNGM